MESIEQHSQPDSVQGGEEMINRDSFGCSTPAESARSSAQISALFSHVQSSGHFDAQLHALAHQIESNAALLEQVRSAMLRRLADSPALKYLPQNQRAKHKSRLFQQFKSMMHEELDDILSSAITDTIEKEHTEKAWVDVVRNAFEELSHKETEEAERPQKSQLKPIGTGSNSLNSHALSMQRDSATESRTWPSTERVPTNGGERDIVEEILGVETNNSGSTPHDSEDDDVVEISAPGVLANTHNVTDEDDDDSVVEIHPNQ